MKVASYNIRSGIHHPRKLSAIADALRPIGADLIALQEVDNGAPRSGKVNQAKVLAELLQLPFSVFSATEQLEAGGETGNGVLSRYPLTGIEVTKLPGSDRSLHTLTHVAVAHPSQAFLLLNTALGSTAAERETQLERIISIVQQRTNVAEAVLLAGSFHAQLGDGELQTLRTVMRDAHSGLQNRVTCPAGQAGGADRTIDYLFYSPEFELVRADVVTEAGAASNHYPLVAQFTL